MCHFVHARLSPSERKQVARLTGIMLPVYASIALAIFAGAYVAHTVRAGTMIAASSDAPAIRAAER